MRLTEIGMLRFSCLVIWVLLALPAWAISATAQGLSTTEAPIQIQVTPAIAAPGDPVSISGLTIVGNRSGDITIAVTPQEGPAVTLTAHTSVNGAFSAQFGETAATGTYRVTATAVDGKGTATDSFAIVTLSGMVDQQASALSDLYEALSESNEALVTLVKATPPSPPQEEALSQSEELGEQLKEAPQHINTYRQVMNKLAELGEEEPIVRPALRPTFDSLNRLADSLRRQASIVRQQVAASRKGSDLCDNLALAVQGLELTGYALNLARGFAKVVNDVWLGFLAKQTITESVLPDAPDATKSAVTLTVKTAFSAIQAVVKKDQKVDMEFWRGKSVNLSNSLFKILGLGIFDRYCEKFEGSVNALFHVDFLNNSTPYLTYDIELTGKMVVHYKKATQQGEAVALVGYIDGNATEFQLWDNVIALDENGICHRLLCLHYDLAPTGMPFLESIGVLPRLATPNHFLVRVGGQIAQGKMTLEILDARDDFSDLVQGRVLVIGFDPITSIPAYFVSIVPFQKARFILDRGMRSKPEFTIVVDQQAQVSRVERTFTRRSAVALRA